MRKEKAAAARVASEGITSRDQMEMMEANIARMVGNLVDARLAALESWLKREEVARLPLAGDNSVVAVEARRAIKQVALQRGPKVWAPSQATSAPVVVSDEEFPSLPAPSKGKGQRSKGGKEMVWTAFGPSTSAGGTERGNVGNGAKAAAWTEVVRRKTPKKKEVVPGPKTPAPQPKKKAGPKEGPKKVALTGRLCKIILDRLSRAIEPLLRREQAGFRPNRSCTDQIITLRIIVEQASECQREMYLTFMDFETLIWTCIWKRSRKVGVPAKIINLIKTLYKKYSCRVTHNGLLSEDMDVPVNAGVSQGCLLSPILFLVVLDGIMQKVKKSKRCGIECHTHRDMQAKLDDLRREAIEMGLKINTRKTQEMRCGAITSLPLLIGTEAVEKVHNNTYLGSIVSESGGTEEDIASRIAKSRAAFAQLRPVWQSRKPTRRVKLKIFRPNVKSVLLYGCGLQESGGIHSPEFGGGG
ncbi:uncharacterized protein LOC133319116 [Danaus plexippus]|uniref:uncharacterized protein LOC133319116 n=1 Tax=Danaus plexippus TaxID=13037 RepID=UPI002AAF2AAC|nr:uncharacterized protein LOC133319116 [Danaus plexippus]